MKPAQLDWSQPSAENAYQRQRFGRLPQATRERVSRRARRLYETSSADVARCWGTAMTEAAMAKRRDYPW